MPFASTYASNCGVVFAGEEAALDVTQLVMTPSVEGAGTGRPGFWLFVIAADRYAESASRYVFM